MQGHPVDIRDHAGWLPIHEAAVHNQLEIAKILVDHGTDINDRAGSVKALHVHVFPKINAASQPILVSILQEWCEMYCTSIEY